MGRGGGGKRKKQGRTKSSSAAAAAEPAPPPAIPHETAWRLLLGEVWQAPDVQLVCRLLCSSRAMAHLVHAACAGRVVASISKQPRDSSARQQEVAAHGEGFSAWLAKHARLLAELSLEVWDEQEPHVAAGLRAAAGIDTTTTGVPQRMSRSSTAVLSAAAAATAAWDSDEQGAAAQPQPLPLRSLVLTTAGGQRDTVACGFRLLPSLAVACPQLTQLKLRGQVLANTQQLVTAFSALQGLRELSLSGCYSDVVPVLQLGSQLTKLDSFGLRLSAEAFSSLPPSLADLEYRPLSDDALSAAGHLTALTRLSCETLGAHSNLPPSVQLLQLNWCSNPAPLHHLTCLRSLNCRCMHCSPEQLQAAVAVIGPSLTALDMLAVGDLGPALLSQRVSGPSLPLTGLSVSCADTSVAHLGQWTGLTELSLMYDTVEDSPQQLAEQVQQLTALRNLELLALRFHDHPQPSLQPLVDAIVGLSSLRSVSWCQCGLDAQQRAQLQGMTQLTHLVVT